MPQAFTRLKIASARRVLDFGCGTGWVIGEAETDPHTQRFGIEFSFEAIRKARMYGSLRIAVADGTSLPFADESFDVVIGHVSMPYMNTERALGEVFRVLTPGGSFFLTFHSPNYGLQRLRRSWRSRNWKDVVFMLYALLNGTLNGMGMEQIRFGIGRYTFETINTPHGVTKTARRAGFESVWAEQDSPGIFFAATASKPNPAEGFLRPVPVLI